MPYAPEYLHLVIPGVKFEAWLYGRNSDDAIKDGGSVEDQLAIGRTFCRDYQWHVLHEFKDVGISASRHGTKTRDDFEDLLDAIENTDCPPGIRRIAVAFEASRYYRNLEEYVRLRSACLRSNTLLCYNGQIYDLSRRDDRKATAQHAIDAEDEAEGIRDRNLRTTHLQAAAGEPHGKLQYGYVREYAFVNGRRRCVGQHEDPVTGKYVLKSLEHMDSGKSLKSLVRWLRSTPKAARHDGATWTEDQARRMLLNRAYLGERHHLGTYRKATWPPIKGLDTPQGRAMFNRVTALLTDPDRRTQRGSEVKHLLSRIGLCGECGDHALLVPRRSSRSGRQTLFCQDSNNTAISEDLIDAFVEEAIVTWFRDKPGARAALIPDDGQVEEKTMASQRLVNSYEEQLAQARQLAETFDEATGHFKLSAASFASMESRLMPKLEAERKKLQSLTGVSPVLLGLLEAEDPDVVWGRLSLEQQREVVRKVVTVRLHRARKPGVRKLEPGRVTLAFVGEPGFRARPLRAPESAPERGRDAAPGSG
ncbi:recombinase family protein [Streptomyces sp. NPDC094153]|uniref:recombinase family protein n=1 Tax=Streptomyces sp. NPDC094153 TaxID=3366058 RepID=UPI00382A96B0